MDKDEPEREAHLEEFTDNSESGLDNSQVGIITQAENQCLLDWQKNSSVPNDFKEKDGDFQLFESSQSLGIRVGYRRLDSNDQAKLRLWEASDAKALPENFPQLLIQMPSTNLSLSQKSNVIATAFPKSESGVEPDKILLEQEIESPYPNLNHQSVSELQNSSEYLPTVCDTIETFPQTSMWNRGNASWLPNSMLPTKQPSDSEQDLPIGGTSNNSITGEALAQGALIKSAKDSREESSSPRAGDEKHNTPVFLESATTQGILNRADGSVTQGPMPHCKDHTAVQGQADCVDGSGQVQARCTDGASAQGQIHCKDDSVTQGQMQCKEVSAVQGQCADRQPARQVQVRCADETSTPGQMQCKVSSAVQGQCADAKSTGQVQTPCTDGVPTQGQIHCKDSSSTQIQLHCKDGSAVQGQCADGKPAGQVQWRDSTGASSHWQLDCKDTSTILVQAHRPEVQSAGQGHGHTEMEQATSKMPGHSHDRPAGHGELDRSSGLGQRQSSDGKSSENDIWKDNLAERQTDVQQPMSLHTGTLSGDLRKYLNHVELKNDANIQKNTIESAYPIRVDVVAGSETAGDGFGLHSNPEASQFGREAAYLEGKETDKLTEPGEPHTATSTESPRDFWTDGEFYPRKAAMVFRNRTSETEQETRSGEQGFHRNYGVFAISGNERVGSTGVNPIVYPQRLAGLAEHSRAINRMERHDKSSLQPPRSFSRITGGAKDGENEKTARMLEDKVYKNKQTLNSGIVSSKSTGMSSGNQSSKSGQDMSNMQTAGPASISQTGARTDVSTAVSNSSSAPNSTNDPQLTLSYLSTSSSPVQSTSASTVAVGGTTPTTTASTTISPSGSSGIGEPNDNILNWTGQSQTAADTGNSYEQSPLIGLEQDHQIENDSVQAVLRTDNEPAAEQETPVDDTSELSGKGDDVPIPIIGAQVGAHTDSAAGDDLYQGLDAYYNKPANSDVIVVDIPTTSPLAEDEVGTADGAIVFAYKAGEDSCSSRISNDPGNSSGSLIKKSLGLLESTASNNDRNKTISSELDISDLESAGRSDNRVDVIEQITSKADSELGQSVRKVLDSISVVLGLSNDASDKFIDTLKEPDLMSQLVDQLNNLFSSSEPGLFTNTLDTDAHEEEREEIIAAVAKLFDTSPSVSEELLDWAAKSANGLLIGELPEFPFSQPHVSQVDDYVFASSFDLTTTVENELFDSKREHEGLIGDQVHFVAMMEVLKNVVHRGRIEKKPVKEGQLQASRRRYVVLPGDTLESIAQNMLCNRCLGPLIYELNRPLIPVAVKNGKQIFLLRPRTIIGLPTDADIRQFCIRLFGKKLIDACKTNAPDGKPDENKISSESNEHSTQLDLPNDKLKNIEITFLAEDCRINRSGVSGGSGVPYMVSLEIKQSNNHWLTILSYQINDEESWRCIAVEDGSKKVMKIHLPNILVKKMAENDIGRNWRNITEDYRNAVSRKEHPAPAPQ